MNYWTNSKALSVSNLNEFGDYVNNLKKWKYLRSTTGTTAISLPDDYDELLVIVDITPEFYIDFTFNIPKLFLDSNNRQFVDGWYSNANSYGSVTIRVNTSSLYLDNAIVNGTDKKNVAVTKVYYR